MKRMTLPAFLAAVVLAFSLAGCSSAQNINEDTLKGTWALDSSSAIGFDAYVNFGDDSVVEMIVADSWVEGEWAVSGTEATLTFDNGLVDDDDESEDPSAGQITAKATYSNNKLTIGSSDGSKLVLVKDDSEETKAMFALDLADEDGSMDQQLEYVDEVINPLDPPVSIADDEQFTISVTGKGTDYTGDPCYVLSVTNKTDKAVYITPEDDFTVGDKTVEPGLGDEIEAGETVEVEVYFAQDELGGGLEALTTTDGVVVLLDDETDDEIAKYAFHVE